MGGLVRKYYNSKGECTGYGPFTPTPEEAKSIRKILDYCKGKSMDEILGIGNCNKD